MSASLSGTHVGLVFSSLTGGGAERVMLTVAKGLLERGADVDFVLMREEGEYTDKVPNGVRVVTLQADREIRILPGMVRYLRDNRPDCVLATGTGINLIALWAKYLARVETDVLIRVQVTLSVDFQDPSRPIHRILPLLVRTTFPVADIMIANSQGVAVDLTNFTRLSPSDIRIVHNPTVSEELFEQAEERVELPWADVDEATVLVAAGRFVSQKDFPTLLRAFASIVKQRNASLLLLGKGEDEVELRQLACDLEIADRVAFPGFVDNPYAYMARADMFVLSSRWEGLPNVLIEALACGTQVVSTDCPSGPDEILQGGEYGTLVPVGDPDALADGIERELATDRDPDALVERAMDFSVEAVLADYADLVANCSND